MSDENEFISEDENNENSVSDVGEETAIVDEVVEESPQTQESFEVISVGEESQDFDKPVDSERLPVEERLDEVRRDNEILSVDDSALEPQPTRVRKKGHRKKPRKSAISLTTEVQREGLGVSKLDEKAIEKLGNQIGERLKINEEKLDKVMSSIRPLEKHIHSTEKQNQFGKQLQVQVRQIQKQIQQIEKMSKNMSTEIIKKINREIAHKLQKMPARDVKSNKSTSRRTKRTNLTKKSKSTKRKRT